MNGGKEAAGGQWCHHEFTNNNFVSFMSHKTKLMVYLISATCLGDLCAAISSPGAVVGGSKRTEV